MNSKMESAAHRQPKYFHCNNCLTNLPIFDEIETPATTKSSLGGTNKLYYTNCSHVVCQACRTTINNCCPFCKRKAQMMQISRRMPRYMQMYFEPLQKSIQNVLKVAKFQKEQQLSISSRLITRYHSIEMKVAAQKTENQKCIDNRKHVIDGYKKVKQILTNLSDERQYVKDVSSEISGKIYSFSLCYFLFVCYDRRRIERQQHHPRQQNRNVPVQGSYQKRPNVHTPSQLQKRRRSRNSRPDIYTKPPLPMSPLVYHEMARSTRDSGFDYSTP